MDTCPYVRLLVGNLSLKLTSSSSSSSVSGSGGGGGVHPSNTPCFCKIRLNNLPSQTSSVMLTAGNGDHTAQTLTLAAAFHLTPADLRSLPSRSRIKISIHTGRRRSSSAFSCGPPSSLGKLLGDVTIPLDLDKAEEKPVVHHNGWVSVGSKAALHVTVRSEPDPRFIFEFGGEPECSPQVFQVQAGRKQPVFTCRFSCRNSFVGDRHNRSRSMPVEPSSSRRSWLSSLSVNSSRSRAIKERKGWSLTVHDLSGSPVALASMVTPFVASPNSDRVSRSNPGAWLILRPGNNTWKPWGRLEAWRERGIGVSDSMGYRFTLVPDCSMTPSSSISLVEAMMTTAKGGKFTIDLTGSNVVRDRSPRGSGDWGMWRFGNCDGFVMSSTVDGEGKCSRPTVEVGAQQVGCTEDAAAFVALAAAIDLSVDACKLFSQKLKKEFLEQVEGSGGGLFA